MNTLNTRVKHLRSTVGTIVMILAFAAVIGGLSIVPALGQDHDRRQGQQEHDRYERERYEEHDRYERERHERARYDKHGRRVYQPYGYSVPIYTPPPVVYPPYQSPGISLFFPFNFH